MRKNSRPEDEEGILSARGFMRDVTDVNMKRIRARLAERGAGADSSIFLRHPAGKDKGQGKSP
jgi:hypothetical protein